MRRSFFVLAVLAALGCLAGSAQAQNFCNVTATIVDPSGIPYANANVTFTLTTASGQVFSSSPTVPTTPATPVQTPTTTSTNSTGTFSTTVACNSAITPASTLWSVQVCPNPNVPLPLGAQSGCFTGANVTISSNPQDISATLNAASSALTRPVTLQASCGGVATSSQTIALLVGGSATGGAPTCTVVAPGPISFVSPRVGTLRYLNCTAATAGTNASSGAVSVLTAPLSTGTMAASAITATFGTGTTAVDVTHTAAVVTGTPVRIQFTTQVAETLAGVVCTLSIT